MRREAPIKFREVPEFAGFPTGAGHCALNRYDDLWQATRQPEIFSSIPTSTSLNDIPMEISEFLGS